MKTKLLLYGLLLAALPAIAQENERMDAAREQQLEGMEEASVMAAANDLSLRQEYYRKHPLNLNACTAEALEDLNMLTGLQVQQFILYRSLLGGLLSVYELQAVPAWDIALIRAILPFITVNDNRQLAEKLKDRWRGGDGSLVLRYGRTLESSRGYGPPATAGASHYLGSRDKLYFRYGYNNKNLLQWGGLGDKDAGEQFFRGSQRQGFDFYSFHLFARNLGWVKSLAIGDFTVNLGQGLMQWQSLAFKKNADVLAIQRQSPVLRPYTAAGEYNFHRGLGLVLQKARWEAMVFASFRKLSAGTATDTASGEAIAPAIPNNGYHRTATELEGRNSLQQTVFGGNIRYRADQWQAGISIVRYHFSRPVQKPGHPYQLFALKGAGLTNAGMHYSYAFRNIYFFGELATDDAFNMALLNGMLVSLDGRADIALLHRNISSSYHSFNANAFTENTAPANEKGWYMGISLRPIHVLRLEAYADLFRFPWLQYRVNAPSYGKEYLIQLTYTPHKQAQIYIRYRSSEKMLNQLLPGGPMAGIIPVSMQNMRLHVSVMPGREISLRSRVEINGAGGSGLISGQGFLGYLEAHYTPSRKIWKGNMRLQYFETSSYRERVYTYESDMPYHFSVPFYYGRGWRYYLNFSWEASGWFRQRQKKQSLQCWLRWAQTIYPGQAFTGSGLDRSSGNHRTEVNATIIFRR